MTSDRIIFHVVLSLSLCYKISAVIVCLVSYSQEERRNGAFYKKRLNECKYFFLQQNQLLRLLPWLHPRVDTRDRERTWNRYCGCPRAWRRVHHVSDAHVTCWVRHWCGDRAAVKRPRVYSQVQCNPAHSLYVIIQWERWRGINLHGLCLQPRYAESSDLRTVNITVNRPLLTSERCCRIDICWRC